METNNMQKYMKTIYGILCLSCALLMSCDLDLQKDYDYKASVADMRVGKTAWEYLQDNSEEFSMFMAAIEYADLKAYYTQSAKPYTFLALSNTAMKSYMVNVFPGEETITSCDLSTVRDMLLYHIVDGAYSSYGQLDVEPMYVLTMLKGEQGLMTMCVWKNPWQAAVGKVLINQAGSNGKSPQRNVRKSNIIVTNGVMHVLDNYCYYQK